MKNQLALLIGVIVAAVLIAQMFSFQVRYDEVAVRATFERADEADLIDGKRDPGLYFRWPWPVQSVYNYSQKLHLLDSRQIEVQTADSKAIIVKLYMTWTIDDALAFYRTQRDVLSAERTLLPMLDDLSNLVPQYEFRQFVNTDPDQLRLAAFEAACTERLRREVAAQNLGIHVEHVGVRQILLDESITPQVFEAMRKHREFLAQQARDEGAAQASAIRSNATSARDRIIAFAERRAQAIRSEGEREAAGYYTEFREDPQFAVFLRQIEALKQILANNTTFILDANELWFLRPLTEEVTE